MTSSDTNPDQQPISGDGTDRQPDISEQPTQQYVRPTQPQQYRQPAHAPQLTIQQQPVRQQYPQQPYRQSPYQQQYRQPYGQPGVPMGNVPPTQGMPPMQQLPDTSSLPPTNPIGLDFIFTLAGAILATIAMFVPVEEYTSGYGSYSYSYSLADMLGAIWPLTLLIIIPIGCAIVAVFGMLQRRQMFAPICSAIAAVFFGFLLSLAVVEIRTSSGSTYGFGMFLLVIGTGCLIAGTALFCQQEEQLRRERFDSYADEVRHALEEQRLRNGDDSPVTDADLAPYLKSKSKLIAGFTGLFLGAFGIHNFYRGRRIRAFIQLGITVVGAATIIAPVAMGIWGFVEGAAIMCSRPGSSWHRDARGIELHD
ncbi:TM2 domain-containing protein [Bifidobacterium choloepi]|nr:TM2 domain-containing protein [Bifidobacterium choloepi]